MYRCKLLLGGQSVGEVKWSLGEKLVSVWAECPFDGGYIYRVTLYGEGEQSLPLGVMVPEKGRFLVRRELPHQKAGLLLRSPQSALRGEIVKTRPGETRTPPLPFAFSSMGALPQDFGGRRDPLLCQCACGTEGVRYARFEGLEYLAFPLRPGQEMAFTPFFCLVTPVRLDGALYGMLCVDKEGDVCRFTPVK